MRFSKAILGIALCIMLLSLAAPAQRRKGRAAAPRKPIVVNAIDLEALKGLISQPREHPLLINFWATYCDPCREEFPDLVKIDRQYRPRSLEFITISLDDVTDIKTGVPKFLGSMKATMPAYLLDIPDPQLAIDLVDPRWQGSLPATFLYNERGELVYSKIGRVKAEELRTEIDKVVKKGEQK